MYIDSGFDKQFLVLFFYPCIVYLTSIIIKYINSDYTYLLRVNDRKAYVKISIKNMIIMLLIFYFHYLILKLISINMVNHANLNIYSIYNKNFQFNTLLLSIILSVRMLLNIILLSIFTYTILIKNKNTNLVWIFVLIIFVYYGDYYYPINKVIDIFNLGLQSYGHLLTNNIIYLVLSHVIFTIIITTILIIIINISIKKIEFGINR